MHSIRHPACEWGFAALVLSTVMAFAPSEAAASCGDYVMLGGSHLKPGNLAGPQHQAIEDDTMPTDESAPCRCQGLGCSDGSRSPMPSPDFKLTLERWATVDCLPGPSSSAAHRLPSTPRISRASGDGLDILRPPR